MTNCSIRCSCCGVARNPIRAAQAAGGACERVHRDDAVWHIDTRRCAVERRYGDLAEPGLAGGGPGTWTQRVVRAAFCITPFERKNAIEPSRTPRPTPSTRSVSCKAPSSRATCSFCTVKAAGAMGIRFFEIRQLAFDVQSGRVSRRAAESCTASFCRGGTASMNRSRGVPGVDPSGAKGCSTMPRRQPRWHGDSHGLEARR